MTPDPLDEIIRDALEYAHECFIHPSTVKIKIEDALAALDQVRVREKELVKALDHALYHMSRDQHASMTSPTYEDADLLIRQAALAAATGRKE